MTPVPDTSTAATIQHSSKNPKQQFNHPLDPLTADEIAAASFALRHYVAAHTNAKAIKFISLYLVPPPKKAVLAFLGIPLSPKSKPEPPVPIIRKAEADFLDIVNGCSYNAILSFKDGSWSVDTLDRLSESDHPLISVEELNDAEIIVRNDPRVQQLAKDVGVQPHQIFCDGWSIGYDDRFPKSRRVQQGFMFARFSQHDNLYAHPLDFIPVLDVHTKEVIHIDFPPHYKSTPNGPVSTVTSTVPPPLTADSLAASGRDRMPPPLTPFNFLPDLMAADTEGYKPRTDIKPLHVVQPEGVSFKMTGNELEWQKWKMHIGFSQREGIAISTITYNDHGEVRPIIYRLSLAEMVVPYGSPDHPHARKFAFDSGEYGIGTVANELSLGCDCLGKIHYMPGVLIAHDGSPHVIKNAICIHEEDAGVLWKHTDFRPGGRSQTVRRRRLVVSMVCTVANYEYIWNYMFYQDGSIEFEIRLTGILQVYVAGDDERSQFATKVAPNLDAQYHQHFFSVRVDPMIDGLHNSVIETDIIPLPDAPTGSPQNFAGNAFITQDTVIKTESKHSLDYQKDRRWSIVNPARKHYSSGKAVGYVIGMKGGATPIMARPGSWTLRRAEFLNNALWVCRDVEGPKGGRMWPAGKYVPQTRDEPDDSVSKWVQSKENVESEDVLLYLTIGTTHIPRPEDWPVMPVETLSVHFKPNSFFKVNPSMDVPGTADRQSVPAFSNGSSTNGHHGVNGQSIANGHACC